MMIYIAIVLICQISLEPNINTCVAMQNHTLYENKTDCMNSIAYLLNSEYFELVYNGYELNSYQCLSLLDIKV